MEKEISKLEEELQIPAKVNDNSLIKDLEKKRRELKSLYGYISEGVKIRSRAQWFESGERETAYFKQLIDFKGKKSAIKELQVDGNITDDEKDIIQEIRRFYSKLYAKSEEGLCENINFFPKTLPKITENQRKLCEEKINQQL